VCVCVCVCLCFGVNVEKKINYLFENVFAN